MVYHRLFLTVLPAILWLVPATAAPIDPADSPYLASHADDPVAWRRWDAEVLAEAANSGKPVFVSIGYLACHWCHVLQRESFRDPDTAALINRLFVPVLIDRERQPDVDALFQAAAARLGLPKGWPLNLFLLADGTPFYGGAYFPPEEEAGVPAFRDVLTRVADMHVTQRDRLAELTGRLVADLNRPRPGPLPDAAAAASLLLTRIDPFEGGFGTAPKHPFLPALDLMWRAYLRGGDTRLRRAVTLSLARMIGGGLHDHVGGGFFRYCVDAHWRVPHFEKMLDVNARILGLTTRVWKETRDPALERAVRGTVEFLLRDLALDGGGFASALDADSPDPETGEEAEGAFYRWRDGEIDRVLGEAAEEFHRLFSLEDGLPIRLGTGDAEATLERLHQARARRPAPRRDDKLLADWNAMAAAALAEAGATFGERNWISAARRTLDILAGLTAGPEGRLAHLRYAGRLGPVAGLDDLAYAARAALTLYEIEGDASDLKLAEGWAQEALDHHADREGGGFFARPFGDAALPLRLKPAEDRPNPSGNAMMIEVLARLYHLTGDGNWKRAATATAEALGGAVTDPLAGAGLIAAADTLTAALQVVIVGREGDGGSRALRRRVFATDLPGRVLRGIGPEERLPEGHPAAHKSMLDGLATAYVCRGTLCSLPVTDAEGLTATLRRMRGGGGP